MNNMFDGLGKIEVEADIKGLGKIVYCNDSPFDISCKAVLKASDSIISLRDMVYASIHDAKNLGDWKNSSLCTDGSYVKEGELIIPNDRVILLSDSLVLKNPSAALEAHRTYLGARSFSEYYLPDLKVDEFLNEIGKDNYCVVKNSVIPIDGFEDYDETRWIFKDITKDYGLFLKDHNVSHFLIPSFSSASKGNIVPYANQLWFGSLASISKDNPFSGIINYENLREMDFHPRKIRGIRFENNTL
jgi:hypothetical protein